MRELINAAHECYKKHCKKCYDDGSVCSDFATENCLLREVVREPAAGCASNRAAARRFAREIQEYLEQHERIKEIIALKAFREMFNSEVVE